jgi:nitroreductase
MMDAITAIHARRSHKFLAEPAPGQGDLRAILSAGAAAPDHGRHHPWRFVVIEGAGRETFGDVLAEAYRKGCAGRGQVPDPATAERERAKPMRAPAIIVVACAAGGDEKVPRSERLAATAAAAQNVLLAATALGYGAMWRTGAPARDPYVKSALGFADDDDIVGFVYIGTIPDGEDPPPARRDLDGTARVWP